MEVCMNNHSLEEIFYRSKLLLDKHGNPDPSVVNESNVTTKEQRLGIEDSTNNMPTSAQHPYRFGDCIPRPPHPEDEDIV